MHVSRSGKPRSTIARAYQEFVRKTSRCDIVRPHLANPAIFDGQCLHPPQSTRPGYMDAQELLDATDDTDRDKAFKNFLDVAASTQSSSDHSD